jgi:hypothetical protein
MSIIGTMKDFELLMEGLVDKNSTLLSGTEKWIDWDNVYSDLLDAGLDGADASVKLDEYMEEKGFA